MTEIVAIRDGRAEYHSAPTRHLGYLKAKALWASRAFEQVSAESDSSIFFMQSQRMVNEYKRGVGIPHF